MQGLGGFALPPSDFHFLENRDFNDYIIPFVCNKLKI